MLNCGKYRLWMHSRRVSFHTRSIGFKSGLYAAGIRSESFHPFSFSTPYEFGHDDISHYPEAQPLSVRHGSFSFVADLKTSRTNPGRISRPPAEKRTFRHVDGQPRNNRCFFGSDGAKVLAPLPLAVPTCGTVNHTVENEPHPKTKCRRDRLSVIAGLFFERLLNLRLGSCDHRSRFSHAKAELAEKSLALANPQRHIKIPSDIRRQ